MGKTRRDLLLAIARKVGGERGRRMRDALRHCELPQVLERAVSDEEFAAHLANAERDLPRILATLENLGPEDPGSWGSPN